MINHNSSNNKRFTTTRRRSISELYVDVKIKQWYTSDDGISNEKYNRFRESVHAIIRFTITLTNMSSGESIMSLMYLLTY